MRTTTKQRNACIILIITGSILTVLTALKFLKLFLIAGYLFQGFHIWDYAAPSLIVRNGDLT
jgi:hypothetical protein